MMKLLHAPLIALMSTLLLAGPTIANTADTAVRAAESGSLSTGSIDNGGGRSKEKRFEDCMAAWDPGTHMTKRQWRRTCRTSMQELPDL